MRMNNIGRLLIAATLSACTAGHAAERRSSQEPLFDMKKILDPSTLEVQVIQNWHLVKGGCTTRQKYVTIKVGELWPGQDYRIPVRFIVPENRKAKGFHLTGGHRLQDLSRDAHVGGVEAELLERGVGLVYTLVQEPRTFGQGELAKAMYSRFIKTLNPHYSVQYWAWPATLMRAITAAYAEQQYFEPGKVAASGGSKNGASPSAAIIHDERITALFAAVSPVWDSPLRLCDRAAWKQLDAFNRHYALTHRLRVAQAMNHPFLGGTFGPIYNRAALAAGHTWDEIQALANRMADHVFISRAFDRLKKRRVDLLFHPGTHDMVAFDVPWGCMHYPRIPVYLRVNSGHGKRNRAEPAERDEQNKTAFLLHHFFDDVEPLLEPPEVKYKLHGRELHVTVRFKPGSKAESGRIWWMYDRGPDGSIAYIRDLFPDDQWKDMAFDAAENAWATTIELKPGASSIDFFSNHRKTITYRAKAYRTYISCPYTRVALKAE